MNEQALMYEDMKLLREAVDKLDTDPLKKALTERALDRIIDPNIYYLELLDEIEELEGEIEHLKYD